MREGLGIMLVENPDGSVAFQAFESGWELDESFKNLVGKVTDPPRRASRLALTWDEDGNLSIDGESKNLPVMPKLPPWGTRLGVGEMEEPEEKEDECRDGQGDSGPG